MKPELMKSTDTVQNILTRLSKEVTLEMENPPRHILRAYAKAKGALGKAHLDFMILNGMMDYLAKKG